MSFNFGNKAVPAFGSPAPSTTAAPTTASTASGFAFGAASPNKPATGMFGTDATKPAGFSFSSQPTNPTTSSIFGASPAAPNFSFGTPQTTQSPMFGGGLTTLPTTAQSTAVGFGFGTQPAQSNTSFASFGAPGNTPVATGLNFGAKPGNAAWPSFGATPSTAAGLNFGQTVTATTVATGLNTNFSFGSGGTIQQPVATTPVAGLNFGQTPPTSIVNTTSSGFNFSQPSSLTSPGLGSNVAKPTLNFGSPNTAVVTPNVSLVPVSTNTGFGNPGLTTPMFSFGNTTNAIIGTTNANIGTVNAGIGSVTTAAVTSTTPAFGLPPATGPSVPMFGKPVTTSAGPSTGFNFGGSPQLSAPTSQTSGFSFGGTTANIPGFGTPPTTTPAPSATQISVIKSTPVVSFTTAAPQTKPAEFSFGNVSVSTTISTTTAALPTSGLGGFQFGVQTPPVASLGNLSTAISTPPSSVQPKTLTSAGLSVGTVSTAAAAIVTSSLTASFTTTTAALTVPGFQLPSTSVVTTSIPTTTSLATTTVSSTVSTQPAPVTSMNFGQLEDAINKWSLELEEQEKVFINQATQVNAWDKLLIANGEKIVALNETLQSVRTEQQSLDHELDFVLGQQRELEELLLPLEKELSNVIITDPEREQTYRLADTIDTQLKQMSEDLKEIIEHLNESNRREDNNDPIVQIGRILNAHMSSMQWIDSSIAQISNKLDQLSNMHNMLKRHNKRSFNLTYK